MFGIPKATYALVLGLAEHYGHLWARYAREEGAAFRALKEAETPQDELRSFSEFVSRRSQEDGDTGPGGILAPTIVFNDAGEFAQARHTTATGRLEWVIWSDGQGNPVVHALIHRPGIEGVLEVYPNSEGYGLRYRAGEFGQRHLRALRDFIRVATLHIPELEPILGRLAGLEAEARKHDASEAQHLLWCTPLEELPWAKPALEDALGAVLASQAAEEFAALLRAVNAARSRWADLAAQRNLEQVEA